MEGEIKGDRRERLGLTVDSQAETGKGDERGDGKHAVEVPGVEGGAPRSRRSRGCHKRRGHECR